ncbi:GFA family protein [Dongia sedimenti]
MEVVHTGRCVCGAVRFTATGDPLRVTICHCTWCQRRTGTAFGTEVVFEIGQVALTGDSVGTYRHHSDESGRWLDVAFCRVCGGNLGFTLEAAPGLRTLPAGAFDDPAWVDAESIQIRHVFVRSRRSWSDLSPLVEQYERHFRTS